MAAGTPEISTFLYQSRPQHFRAKEATQGPWCHKVGGPGMWFPSREILLLTAPSGLLCGNWDFSSPFSRRCSHGYRIQVKTRRSRRYLTIVKPSGSLHPRVQKVGPEHFGIVAVDCAKARSKWMLPRQLSRQRLHHGVALIAGFVQNQEIIRRRFGFRCKLNRRKDL